MLDRKARAALVKVRAAVTELKSLDLSKLDPSLQAQVHFKINNAILLIEKAEEFRSK